MFKKFRYFAIFCALFLSSLLTIFLIILRRPGLANYKFLYDRYLYNQVSRSFSDSDVKSLPFEGYVSYPNNETLQLHCKTCAYVTGSGHMTGSEKGKEIDSMSCVFRSNDAPTIGYEIDVGRKTTVRTVDRNSLRFVTDKVKTTGGSFDPLILEHTILLAYSKPYDWLYKQMNETHNTFPKIRLNMFTPAKYEELLDIFAERVSGNEVWASNGFLTIYFAHDVCDEIHVYGINEEHFCEDVRANVTGIKDVYYHYYSTAYGMNCDYIKYLDGGRTHTHHFTKEKAHYRKLMNEWKNIHFHAPEWEEIESENEKVDE